MTTTLAVLGGCFRRRILLPGLGLLVLSCGGGDDGGTGPNHPGVLVPASIGDTVSGQWSNAADSVTYRAKAGAATILTVYGEAHTTGFILSVTDSATGASLASVGVAATASTNLFATRTSNFNVAAGHVVLVRVRPGNGSGSYRLFLAEVNTGPESGAAVVAAGDTIHSTLEHPADIDRFFVHAVTPLEIAAFVRSLTEGIAVGLGDSADPASFSYAFAAEDAVPSHLMMHRTSNVVVPAGHTAEVRVSRSPGDTHAGGYEVWLYPVNRAPEHVPAAMLVNDTVAGEVLENSADIDEFTVTIPSPTELIGYLGGTPQLFPQSAWLFVSGGGLAELPNVQHQPGTSELEGSATGRFRVTAGQLKVEVRGVSVDVPANQSGPSGYSVMLRQINRLPEHVSATLVTTDTVENEGLDYVGDIDEFSLPVQAGDLYNGFLQVPGVASQPHLDLTVTASADTVGRLLGVTSGATLSQHYTGDISAPANGSLTFAVQGQSDHDVADRGSYRLFAYKINPGPEILPANIAPGDSLFGETIEFPGDADNFLLAQGTGDNVNIFLVRSPGDSGTLNASVDNSGGGSHVIICLAAPQGPQGGCASGSIPVSEGPQSLAVGGYTGFYGQYGVAMYSLSDAPEGQPGTLQIGIPINSQLSPPGDLDRYTFQYTKGQLFDVTIAAGPELNGFGVNALVDRQGIQIYGQTPYWPRTGRFELPQTGTYTLEVFGSFGGSQYGEQGSYTITLDTVPLGPEQAMANVLPGDTRSENIDVLGDVDEFILTAAPGSLVQARLSSGGAPLSAFALGDSLPLVVGHNGVLGRVTMPGDGKLRVRVAEIRGVPGPIIFTAYSNTGPYSIAFYQINPAPEHVPAAITLGTPVVGEDLPIEGELDEFTFTGNLSQVVTGTISNPQGFNAGVTVLEILDPTGTTVLGSTTSHDGTVGSTGPITLPASGVYIVRIQAQDDTSGTGGYQFTIQ